MKMIELYHIDLDMIKIITVLYQIYNQTVQ